MALSNWDTMAVNLKGEPTDGTFTSPHTGVTVEIYKNWLYVADDTAWNEKVSYTKPTIAEVYEGSLQYKDVQIVAKRGPRSGVYCVVYTYAGDELLGMVGIGCYGYDEDGTWRGIGRAELVFLRQLLAANEDLPEEIRSVPLDRAMRFNQGDRYIAEQLGEATPTTPVGKAETPLFERLFTRRT